MSVLLLPLSPLLFLLLLLQNLLVLDNGVPNVRFHCRNLMAVITLHDMVAGYHHIVELATNRDYFTENTTILLLFRRFRTERKSAFNSKFDTHVEK